MRLCSIEGCSRKHHCGGYCHRHYNQVYNNRVLSIPGQKTLRDSNEFIIDGFVCWIILYNKQCIEITRAKFNMKYYEQIKISNLKWHLLNPGYAQGIWYDETGQHQITLHEAIIQLSGQIVPDGYEIDHKDGNKLNCLDDNLRICTRSQNGQNRGRNKNNTSGFVGVIYDKQRKKWKTRITINYKKIYLGHFDIIEDAARAYNVAAIKYFGEFAQVNEV